MIELHSIEKNRLGSSVRGFSTESDNIDYVVDADLEEISYGVHSIVHLKSGSVVPVAETRNKIDELRGKSSTGSTKVLINETFRQG